MGRPRTRRGGAFAPPLLLTRGGGGNSGCREGERLAVVGVELDAELRADAREDLGDARLAYSELAADLGSRKLIDVEENEDLLLALGEAGDRLSQGAAT